MDITLLSLWLWKKITNFHIKRKAFLHYKRQKYQTQVEKMEPHHTCRQIMDDTPNRRRIILTCKTTVVVVVVMIMMVRMAITEEEITYWKKIETQKKNIKTLIKPENIVWKRFKAR
jgi:hypothetical protein